VRPKAKPLSKSSRVDDHGIRVDRKVLDRYFGGLGVLRNSGSNLRPAIRHVVDDSGL
jgi:hypothetical protein